jgi:hypothetical protein
MKILFNYCTQSRRYADSYGECLVLLEEGDDKEEIKREFHKERAWYEQSYSFDRECKEYVEKKYSGDVVHTGNMLLFKTRRAYLD